MKVSIYLFLILGVVLMTNAQKVIEKNDDYEVVLTFEDHEKNTEPPTVEQSSKETIIEKNDDYEVVLNFEGRQVNTEPPTVEQFDKQESTADKEPADEPETDATNENDPDENEYKDGSVCVYCKYCKLCKLCEKCPCKSPDQHDQCSSCKYCKYCTLCGNVCDTVCTPGGLIDLFSSAVYDALPTFDRKTREGVQDDIDRAKDFIKEYL